MNSDKEIIVWYVRETDIDPEPTPLDPTPGGDVDIIDDKTPLDDGSGIATGDGDEVTIVDDPTAMATCPRPHHGPQRGESHYDPRPAGPEPLHGGSRPGHYHRPQEGRGVED